MPISSKKRTYADVLMSCSSRNASSRCNPAGVVAPTRYSSRMQTSHGERARRQGRRSFDVGNSEPRDDQSEDLVPCCGAQSLDRLGGEVWPIVQPHQRTLEESSW